MSSNPVIDATAMGLFLGALFSKTTTVVWPIGMITIIWWKRGAVSWKRDVLPLIPFVVLALLDGWVALSIERDAVGNATGELQFSLAQRLVIAGHACWFYLEKLFWPLTCARSIPGWLIDNPRVIDYLYPVGVLGVAGRAVDPAEEKSGSVGCVIFFVGALSPLLGIFSFSYQRYSFVADHFQYLASLGVVTLVTAGGVWLWEKWRLVPRFVGTSLCVAVLTILAILTRNIAGRSWIWGTFARATLAGNPYSWVARDHLGLVLTSEGKGRKQSMFFHQALPEIRNMAWATTILAARFSHRVGSKKCWASAGPARRPWTWPTPPAASMTAISSWA